MQFQSYIKYWSLIPNISVNKIEKNNGLFSMDTFLNIISVSILVSDTGTTPGCFICGLPQSLFLMSSAVRWCLPSFCVVCFLIWTCTPCDHYNKQLCTFMVYCLAQNLVFRFHGMSKSNKYSIDIDFILTTLLLHSTQNELL